MLADCTAHSAAEPRWVLLDDLTISYHPLLRSRWQLCCLTDAAHPLRVPLCLRIGSLYQFPLISDILLYFIIVDRSVSFQQIQVYMQSFSASFVLHTVFRLSADQFVQ